MEKDHSSLFQVYLRLRPAASCQNAAERFVSVESPSDRNGHPTHITLNPPNDRRRAVEKFGFTQVFEEDANQLDVFHCTRVTSLVEGVVAPLGGEGTDALVATLGVTGSGKTHTILGSKTQRGITQLSLDLLFRSIKSNIVDVSSTPSLDSSINASDASEANIVAAQSFCESIYGDANGGGCGTCSSSRAQTPMLVGTDSSAPVQSAHRPGTSSLYPEVRFISPSSPTSVRLVGHPSPAVKEAERKMQEAVQNGKDGRKCPGKTPELASLKKGTLLEFHFLSSTQASSHKMGNRAGAKTQHVKGDSHFAASTPIRRPLLQLPSVVTTQPDISGINVSCDPGAEYAVLISMYEVYNDRIFDLLSPPIKMNATKELRRRPLLFKSTEHSPDRKVVAGLRKIICTNLREAILVLEAALHERRVAGTGSNSMSSRSHGFFCVEVKKRPRGRHNIPWSGSTLTIVDLAGSERARDAKTAGATLAEAGKINESLMYLGQCLQMQSDAGASNKSNVVPFRQCKLTELLFSNSFPPSSLTQSTCLRSRRNPQKGVMIVTADPHGDFNATSQILRYSALAREITVPRIPSITQRMLSSAAAAAAAAGGGQHSPPLTAVNTSPQPIPSSSPILSNSPVLHSRPFYPPGVAQPQQTTSYNVRTFSPASETMELAALEISRLTEELDAARAENSREREARIAAEAHLESWQEATEDRMLELELTMREEISAQYEEQYAVEVARMQNHFMMEQEKSEEHTNRKIEALGRGLGAYDDKDDYYHGREHDEEGGFLGAEDKENVLVENLEDENKRLRHDVEVLRRELATMRAMGEKRKPLAERDISGASGRERASLIKRKAKGRGGGAGGGGGDLDGSLIKKISGLRVKDNEVGLRDSTASVASSAASGSPVKRAAGRRGGRRAEHEV